MPLSTGQPGPGQGAGLLWSTPVPQVTTPQFTALSGQCQAWALTRWLLAKGPRTDFLPLRGRRAQRLALGSFREQQLPCLLGLGTRLPSVAVGEAKPGGAQESPLPPIPTWGQGPHQSEPVFSLQNGISDLSFTGPVRMKWHRPARCLPGGGGLLGRGTKEAWGIESSELSHHFPRKKAECSSLCSATRQLRDPVKVVLPLGVSLLVLKVGWQWSSPP